MSENVIINYNGKIYNLKEVIEDDYYKLVNNKNEVAILYSPGNTSGWYTWNRYIGQKLIKDSRIIQYFFSDKYKDYKYEQFFKEVMQFEQIPFPSKNRTFKIAFIPQDTKFVIEEYDGSESIHTIDEMEWINA